MNKLQPHPKCINCDKEATYRGRYENPDGPLEYACDDCCGHAKEDGWCHPIDPANGAFLCSPEQPMPKGREKMGIWAHTNLHEVLNSQRDNYPCGDLVDMICDDCGVKFTKELPQ